MEIVTGFKHDKNYLTSCVKFGTHLPICQSSSTSWVLNTNKPPAWHSNASSLVLCAFVAKRREIFFDGLIENFLFRFLTKTKLIRGFMKSYFFLIAENLEKIYQQNE